MQVLKKTIFASALLLTSMLANAAVPAWQIVPASSSITFTATQNNSPIIGQFKSFSGDINFDPAQLKASSVKISVDLASVTTSYKEVQDTLKTTNWFDVKAFPQAVFQANDFTKTGNNAYTANGTLSIRDKTVPVVLNFVLDQYTADKAHATGSVQLKRLAFGVGQGEWASTDDVKDAVKVDFVVTAVKK